MVNHLNDEAVQNYLDGQINTMERAAIRQHIESCDECRHKVAAFQELFSQLERDIDFELSKNFTKQVLKKTHKEAIGSVQFGLTQLFFALAAAIVVIYVVQYYVQVENFAATAQATSNSFQKIFSIIVSAFEGIANSVQFDGMYVVLAIIGLIGLFIFDRFILQPRFRPSSKISLNT
jgi:anti-sigma factor RsiW